MTDTVKKTEPLTFEAAMARLETLTQAMQGNELPLDEALKAYEEGGELIKFCQQKLADVAQKLSVLDGDTLTDLDLDV
ncbi:MAG: exodeoxyribonuclease VII small subunit [Neisseriaceae bacterium]|nr:exodeoxyribonuclease VII small subunit [Neisseriaceae bacterium]